MSHYAAHYAAVFHNYSVIMILEDDAGFKPGFEQHVAHAVALLEQQTITREWIVADHLQETTLVYHRPSHPWDQLTLSQWPHIHCPNAARNDTVCFMPLWPKTGLVEPVSVVWIHSHLLFIPPSLALLRPALSVLPSTRAAAPPSFLCTPLWIWPTT